jgi:hypothetical protein
MDQTEEGDLEDILKRLLEEAETGLLRPNWRLMIMMMMMMISNQKKKSVLFACSNVYGISLCVKFHLM